ncbi:MAG TPA: hypothetical protein PKV72_01745, partial [Candidatus Peribacteria bacterium]|nr:hypothetical protein [Candidatus Peribacteria bacterium]
MPSLPVCVRLPHDVAYSDCGKKTNVPAGTAIDWLTVVNIFSPSALDLVPSEPYESLKVGALQYFTWGGRTTKSLRI